MQYRVLGKTDLQVSTVCMGCWAIVGDFTWGKQDESDAIAAIHASLDAGITFFDTAPGYGNGYSEELLEKALRDSHVEVVIADKVGSNALTWPEMRQQCERSLQLLRRDVIDLYQIHWPNWDVPWEVIVEGLLNLQKQGKIRYPGVCNFGKQDLTDMLAKGRIESDQMAYSLLWRGVEFDVLPVCVENEVSLLCYSPLCQGLLTGKFSCADDVPEGRARSRLFSKDRPQSRHSEPGCEEEVFRALFKIQKICDNIGRPMGEVALAWLLAQPGVTSVIAGARNAEQARANALAADLQLPREILDELAHVTDEIKEKMGTNVDMWQTESRIR